MGSKAAIVPLPEFKAGLVTVEESSRTTPDDSISRMTAAMARGDEAAFHEFFQFYYGRLLRYHLSIARGDETAARDALQDTVTRVARHVRRFDEERIFWDWLTVLARSAARDVGRKQVRHRRLLQRFFDRFWRHRGEGQTGARAAGETVNDSLARAVEELPDLERNLVEQKYFEGASVRDLAIAHGLTEKAVESRLLRARRSLRETVKKDLSDES